MADVTLAEMKEWSDAVFASLKHRGVDKLDRVDGFYWSIDSEMAWESGQEPSSAITGIGDLADDIADIRNDVRESKSDPHSGAVRVWHTLDHLIGVLTALSYQLKTDGQRAPEREAAQC